jgi:uncharacterized protein YodC (DUF2158 family)
MTFEPGQVVTLKSGSQAMTVVAVAEEDIDCVWIGEEGEFFRQAIPAVALTAIDADQADIEDEADSDDAEDEADEEETAKTSRKRSAA